MAFRFKKDLKKFQFPEKIPLVTTVFDYFEKDKIDDKYYMDGHRMWKRMMEYMDDKKGFIDLQIGGCRAVWREYVQHCLRLWVVNLNGFLFFMIIILSGL